MAFEPRIIQLELECLRTRAFTAFEPLYACGLESAFGLFLWLLSLVYFL